MLTCLYLMALWSSWQLADLASSLYRQRNSEHVAIRHSNPWLLLLCRLTNRFLTRGTSVADVEPAYIASARLITEPA